MKAFQVITFLILAAIAIVAALMTRPRGDHPASEGVEGLPWQIEAMADGTSRVFGLELGRSTLEDARQRFGDDINVGVVAAPGEQGTLEAYFDNVTAGVITGRMILATTLASADVVGMRQRAIRRTLMNDATYRYDLNPQDLARALRTPIETITFIPAANIDAATVLARFGTPGERLQTQDHLEHFLYPHKGLDLIIDAKGKDVLQYVAPRDFARLREPLHQPPERTGSGTD